MKQLTDIRDLHPGLLLDYLVKLNDFNKRILQTVGTLQKKCSDLEIKLNTSLANNVTEGGASSSSPTSDISPTSAAAAAAAADVGDRRKTMKEVELEARVDAIEQKANVNILMCSGAVIRGAINADPSHLKERVISCINDALPNVIKEEDIVKVSYYGKKKTHVKIECSSMRARKRLISSARENKPAEIYFSEFLTNFRNTLFYSLRSLRNKYKDKILAVYVRDGNIFYKLRGVDGFNSVRTPLDVTKLEKKLTGSD